MSKSAFVNSIYQAAVSAGLSDAAARVTASQAAIESGYGAHAPGNNYFGIKAGKSWDGPTQRLWTHEVNSDGKSERVKQTFRVYATPEEGMADRIKFMDQKFPGFSQSQTVGDAYNVLQNGKYGRYATAKRADYEGALNHVNTSYLGGTPVPPENIPSGSSSDSAGTYRVKSGDTLNKIAAKLGTTADELARANGISDPNKIVAGRTLNVAAAAPLKSLGNSIYDKMPADASYGVQQRLNPGQKAQLPADFQTLFAHGAPDARTMSLAAPARSLGAGGNVGNATTANGSATIVPGRSLGQTFLSEDHPRSNVAVQPGAIRTATAPAATVQMAAARPANVPAAPSQLQLLNNGNSPLDDIHDSRDAAVVAAQNATKPTFTVPKATYTPPANNNVGAAPAPQKQGLFQSLGGAIGSGMTALGNSANDAAKYLGKGVQDTVAAIPDKAQEAADYLTPLVLGNLEARSAFLDPMIARLGSPTAGDHSPTRYGATFQDRQQAAQDRERLSQNLPPIQRQSQPQPQPQPQQRQQAPVITTTFRNTAPSPPPKSNSSPAPANNNGGGNSGGGNGGGQQTITGSATGRTYNVGQVYSNKDGNFQATPTGFKKVS